MQLALSQGLRHDCMHSSVCVVQVVAERLSDINPDVKLMIHQVSGPGAHCRGPQQPNTALTCARTFSITAALSSQLWRDLQALSCVPELHHRTTWVQVVSARLQVGSV
jgi:hypothetical protein